MIYIYERERTNKRKAAKSSRESSCQLPRVIIKTPQSRSDISLHLSIISIRDKDA